MITKDKFGSEFVDYDDYESYIRYLKDHNNMHSKYEDNRWMIKIGNSTESKVPGFEKYVYVSDFSETINCPKNYAELSSSNNFSNSGNIEFILPSLAQTANLTLSVFGKTSGSDTGKPYIDLIELIQVIHLIDFKNPVILQKIQYKKMYS
jgi:hypothetical protein